MAEDLSLGDNRARQPTCQDKQCYLVNRAALITGFTEGQLPGMPHAGHLPGQAAYFVCSTL